MPTQSEKINKLDKEVAIIKKDIEIIKTNHLVHLDKRLLSVQKVLWTVGILVFFKSNYSAQRYTFIIISIYLSSYGQETP